MNFRYYAASELGRVRRRNEDAFVAEGDLGLFAVADGIGGLPGGAEASDRAVEVLRERISANRPATPEQMVSLIREANEAVHAAGLTISPHLGMGTTLTLLLVSGRQSILTAHVGDSALYRIRGGNAEKLSEDHTVENEMRLLHYPREMFDQPGINRQALTRCLGQPSHLNPDCREIEIEGGDRFLLCTDGVTRAIDESELGRLVEAAVEPQPLVEELIRLANERGGFDNATAVALFF